MKRFSAYLLAAALVLSLAACGQQNTPGTSAAGAGTSEAASGRTLEDTPHPTQDPLGKYDPAIDVTMVHSSNDGAFWFPEGDSIDNNIYTRRYSEQLGINYSFKWTSPGSQSEEKMSTMFASGDLPDLFSVSRRQFEQLYAAGSLADLTDAIVDYASDYTRGYLSGDYKGLMDAATKDGRYYGLTNGFAYNDGGEMVWVRKDWLNKLNLETPKTLADLESAMTAFKERNPSGHAAADVYPIALNAASQQSYEWTLNPAFFNMFNSYPNAWYLNSKGEIEHGMFGAESRARTREALVKANEYYNQGFINPGFGTTDFDMRNEAIFQGKAGVVFGDVWGAYWPLILHLDTDAEADWVPIPVPQGGAEKGKISRYDAQVQNILVARKDFAYPEAIVKMTNLYHDLNNNPATMEFEDYNTNPSDSNQIFLCYPLQIYNPSFNIEGYHLISEAQEKNDFSNLCSAYKMFYEQAMDYEATGAAGGWSPYRSYLQGETSLAVLDSYIQNDQIVFIEYTDEPTEFMLDNEPTVKKMYDTMVVGVINGSSDISAYDEFLAQWDSIYGDTATKEVNDWFQAKGGESIHKRMTGK